MVAGSLRLVCLGRLSLGSLVTQQSLSPRGWVLGAPEVPAWYPNPERFLESPWSLVNSGSLEALVLLPGMKSTTAEESPHQQEGRPGKQNTNTPPSALALVVLIYCNQRGTRVGSFHINQGHEDRSSVELPTFDKLTLKVTATLKFHWPQRNSIEEKSIFSA